VRLSSFVFLWRARKSNARSKTASVVVKDLRFKDEDKDKESSFMDKDKDKDLMSKNEDKVEDLKIGPRGSSRTRTFFEDNNTVNTGSQINTRVF